MPQIFKKTALGQQEIETRAGRIPPRLRSALILVDGKRTEAELRKLVLQPDETLRALLDAGMIESAGAAEPSRGPSREAPAESAPAAAPAAAPSAPAAPKQDFAAWRREVVRAVNDMLGPAGEAAAMRLEKAADEAALRAAIERVLPVIGNVRGGATAAQFAKRFLPD